MTHSRSRDVVVVGVHSDPATRLLCRSLQSGTAFSDYRAVLVDLRDASPVSRDCQREIERAAHDCLARHQVFGVVAPGQDVPRAIGQARQLLALLDGRAGSATASQRVAVDLLVGVIRTATSVIKEATSALLRRTR